MSGCHRSHRDASSFEQPRLTRPRDIGEFHADPGPTQQRRRRAVAAEGAQTLGTSDHGALAGLSDGDLDLPDAVEDPPPQATDGGVEVLHHQRFARPSSATPRTVSRSDAAEACWLPIRPQLLEGTLATASSKTALWTSRREAEAEVLQRGVSACASQCPTCGQEDCVAVAVVSVVVIGQHYSHKLSLPIRCCPRSVRSHAAAAVANNLRDACQMPYALPLILGVVAAVLLWMGLTTALPRPLWSLGASPHRLCW